MGEERLTGLGLTVIHRRSIHLLLAEKNRKIDNII